MVNEATKNLLDPILIAQQHDRSGESYARNQQELSYAQMRELVERVQNLVDQITQEQSTIDKLVREKIKLHDQLFDVQIKLEEMGIAKVIKSWFARNALHESISRKLIQVNAEIEAHKVKLDAWKVELEVCCGSQIELPSDILEKYYEDIASFPLEVDEKCQHLTPEFIASLTTEQYILLWRRLNPHYLSHASKHGATDHTRSGFSTLETAGAIFCQNFVRLLEDGQIRSTNTLLGLKDLSEASVEEWCTNWRFWQADNYEDAMESFNKAINFSNGVLPRYADKSAVHFACEQVLNIKYGAEQGNECFFIVPVDVIASQQPFGFGFPRNNFTDGLPKGEYIKDDVLVWPDEPGAGVSLDIGFAFLPKSILVDPDTGSKYSTRIIDQSGERILDFDHEAVDLFIAIASRYFSEPSDPMLAFRDYKAMRDSGIDVAGDTNFDQEIIAMIESYFADAGLSQLNAQRIASELFDLQMSFPQLSSGTFSIEDYRERLVQLALDANLHLKIATSPIPAQQYWESLFESRPELRPKHIVYYDGHPTAAVTEFLRENGIGKADTSVRDGKFLGFDHNLVTDMETDPRSTNGKDEFIRIAEKLINDRYSTPEALTTQI